MGVFPVYANSPFIHITPFIYLEEISLTLVCSDSSPHLDFTHTHFYVFKRVSVLS